MLPTGCPEWQYSAHPDCAKLLPAATAALITGILTGKYLVKHCARDTRPIHKLLFAGLGPTGHAYYVGNYRGAAQRCLRKYEVQVVGEPLACLPAADVLHGVTSLGVAIAAAVDSVDRALTAASGTLSPPQRTVAVVRVACDAFVRFLTVHPYADGNGHTARAMLWIVLFHFGYVPSGWTIDPRPPFPTYAHMISQHRRGNVAPLEEFVLTCISTAK